MDFTRDELKLIRQLVQAHESDTQEGKSDHEYDDGPISGAMESTLAMCDSILQAIERKLHGLDQ